MPIDPFAVLNAMIRAEAARSDEPAESGAPATLPETEHETETSGDGRPGPGETRTV